MTPFRRLLIIFPLSLLFLIALACSHGGNAGNASADPNPSGTDNGQAPSDLSKKFDADNSFDFLIDQMNFGYRIPGTDSHAKCGDWIVSTLKEYGWEVEEQTFTATVRGSPLPIRNIIARFGWTSGSRNNIMLAAHWDTRPWCDQDIPENRHKPVPGANDGASGVAVLLELARVFSETPPLVGVELVFFDGEDYGPELSAMFIGSKYFADRLSVTRINSYRWGVLLDMIGDRDLQIHPEYHSEAIASDLYGRIITFADLLGYGAHFHTTGTLRIFDDHVALIDRGIKMYDLIDFDYPWWHTVGDTADKCSPDSLKIIGRTIENLVYAETLDMDLE